MKVFFCNIEAISDACARDMFSLLPATMKEEIARYRNPSDQKSRIVARVIIAYFFGSDFRVLDEWVKGTDYKPYIPGRSNFNISHSGKFVVVVFFSFPVGIDIELVQKISVENISLFFTSLEIDHLKKRDFNLRDFYTIWVKKEAYLKAQGIGIVNGLDHIDVLDDHIFDANGSWFFREIKICSDYICYACSNSRGLAIDLEEFEASKVLR